MISAGPDDLPDFENPPVIETVLSAQFQPLGQMRTAHFGLFWNLIRDRYPTTEERSALDPVVERFPEPVRRRLGVQFPILESPPLPRVWFVHKNQNELLQVQSDRFIRNWRKKGDGDTYPRYEKVRAWFNQDFREFQDFAAREKLGTIEVNQCEVTYVNHIVAGEGWTSHEDIDRVLTVWRHPSGSFPGKTEDAVFHARFLIRDAAGHPVGRLHVDAQAALRNADNRPMFVVTLTARGMLGKTTEFLDLGRQWIVRSFAEITTPEMHLVWKRRR
ncbi:MAG: TIGR04255 family protein [Bryobacteraceae bacterium]|nr:TIGR04255 family protein [Bryobacteraceae bacterium]